MVKPETEVRSKNTPAITDYRCQRQRNENLREYDFKWYNHIKAALPSQAMELYPLHTVIQMAVNSRTIIK